MEVNTIEQRLGSIVASHSQWVENGILELVAFLLQMTLFLCVDRSHHYDVYF